jgi:tRNA(fMet)-specific endonuclease VapC
VRLALDTNRYTDLARGDAAVGAAVDAADAVFLPFIVLGELRAGFAAGTRAKENEKFLQQFLHKAGVAALMPDDATTFQYGVLMAQLRRAGTPIPTNDVWIAALTLQHGLTLYARDRHFDLIPQLMRL